MSDCRAGLRIEQRELTESASVEDFFPHFRVANPSGLRSGQQVLEFEGIESLIDMVRDPNGTKRSIQSPTEAALRIAKRHRGRIASTARASRARLV